MRKNFKVLKIGGSVFPDKNALPTIANAIRREMDDAAPDGRIIVVVSAMGHTTDELRRKVGLLSDGGYPAAKHTRETDKVLSTGETLASGILADYLAGKGIKTESFTGGQAGIVTNDNFGDADIKYIKTENLGKFLTKNEVAVVAGFQGETEDGDITTLGANGSDTTAFYLAYHFNAGGLVLYKDTPGVYDKNPKEFKDARLYRHINYEDVLKLRVSGIIHDKALRLCTRMFEGDRNPKVIVKSIIASQSLRFTTIGKGKTEFYR